MPLLSPFTNFAGMIPKIIHLCWFSSDPYPVEIKICLDSWRRVLPDYEIKLWDMAAARAIGIPFVNEALDERRWAFAGDVVRFYAVWKYGGVYMDSDIFLYRRFDEFMPGPGEGFATFHEKIYPEHENFGLQAAFFIGEKGNEFCREMVERYPELHFDFHAHNDYDLAVANVMAAVKAGVRGIHTTVNGLGERAGNAPLSSVAAVLNDHLKVRNAIVEKNINHVSRLVETYTGIHIPANEPVVGENVFTQCAGIHADGDNKSHLYYNDLLPERFGRVREYALGKTSGKANIKKNLETLGIDLDDEAMRKVTERIIELGDKKQAVTSEDLPYIIADVLKQDVYETQVHILNYNLSLSQGLRPVATLKIRINDEEYEQTSSGDGQYDAFMRALRKIYKEQLRREFPMLVNYTVSIPPGGRTDAFVQTYITWEYRGDTFKTRGLDADQTEAAIKATLKMLNKLENMQA